MRELEPGAPWADAVSHAASVLYEAGARAVWLFGSRAGTRPIDRLSDFDLAVEGLPAGTAAIDLASRALWGRVDIVRLEAARPGLRWGCAQSRIFVPRRAITCRAPRSRPPLPDTLAGARTRIVAGLIRAAVPRSVIDFGCGSGWLLVELAADDRYERLTGVDFDRESLAAARRRIAGALVPGRQSTIALVEGLVTHRDPAYLAHDAAAAVEVIEHLEAPQLEAFESLIFSFVRPKCAVLTTPNSEYNVFWRVRRPRGYRHPDHRFEWSRREFVDWANQKAANYGYDVRFEPVGTVHPEWGPPTQLAVFDKKN